MRKRAKKARRSRKQPEGNIQDAIRELIAVKYRWRHRRNNVHGPARVFGGGMAKCGTPGEADITVFVPAQQHCGHKCHFIFHIEVKKPGEYQTPEQKAWQLLVESCDEFYLLARSQQDVMDFVIAKGWSK